MIPFNIFPTHLLLIDISYDRSTVIPYHESLNQLSRIFKPANLKFIYNYPKMIVSFLVLSVPWTLTITQHSFFIHNLGYFILEVPYLVSFTHFHKWLDNSTTLPLFSSFSFPPRPRFQSYNIPKVHFSLSSHLWLTQA